MRCATLLLPVLACLLAQGAGKVPPKEDLCGLIVDSVEEQKCLKCFTDAGDIRKHPGKVRKCVGKHLPPDVAECSVPHPDHRLAGESPGRRPQPAGPGRMQHGPSHLHHNHTNANLLPNCLLRRMRDMARYLKRENRFTREAGRMIKYVAVSKVLRDGGPTMLGIGAQHAILDLPEVQEMINTNASSCLADFDGKGSETQRGLGVRNSDLENDEDEDEDDLEEKDDDEDDLESLLRHDDYHKDVEKTKLRSGQTSSLGNNLPFGGTNILARHILLGQCIIRALVENGAGMDLLEILQDDRFFYPIPQWWVEPLLRLQKAQSRGSN